MLKHLVTNPTITGYGIYLKLFKRPRLVCLYLSNNLSLPAPRDVNQH